MPPMIITTIRNALAIAGATGVAVVAVSTTSAVAAPAIAHGGMSPNSSSRAAAINRSNEQKAFDFFVSKGLSKKQAAGIVGNFDQESGMDPTIKQLGGGPGRGIAQWSVGGRWDTSSGDNQVDYTASHGGGSSFQLQPQLDFTWYELSHFSGYGLSALKATNYVNDATTVFAAKFEVCGDCNNAARIQYADDAYARYK